MRSNLTAPVAAPDTGLVAAKLYRQVITARRVSERADADAARATVEAQEARHLYESLEAEYRAVKTGATA